MDNSKCKEFIKAICNMEKMIMESPDKLDLKEFENTGEYIIDTFEKEKKLASLLINALKKSRAEPNKRLKQNF